jgi:outer dense fiber protein 2
VAERIDEIRIEASVVFSRKITSLQEENNRLSKALHSKEPDARRPSQINSPLDQGQDLSRLRLDFAQLKREKEDNDRSFKSQLNDLRDKLEQSTRANRSMQNYLNSLKTTYTTLFNDTLPSSGSRFTTA